MQNAYFLISEATTFHQLTGTESGQTTNDN